MTTWTWRVGTGGERGREGAGCREDNGPIICAVETMTAGVRGEISCLANSEKTVISV